MNENNPGGTISLVMLASFLAMFIVLGIIFWVAYLRGRRKQMEAQDELSMKSTELLADEEERQRRKEAEMQQLALGAMDMMLTYLRRTTASTQMAAWVKTAQVEVPASEQASVKLYFHTLDTVVEPVRRAMVNGKEVERERPVLDMRKEYADKVGKALLKAVSESFANMPTLQHMVVDVYVPAPSQQGTICVASVLVNRQVFQVVRDLQRGPTLEILQQFDFRMDCNPTTWELGQVTPFELPLLPMDQPAPEPAPSIPSSGGPLPSGERAVGEGSDRGPLPSGERAVGEGSAAGDAQRKFEEAVRIVLEQGGMRVQEQVAPADGKLDIRATSVKHGTEKILIRARRTRDTIEADELLAFADEAAPQTPDKLFYLTTSSFDLDAVQAAVERKIELLDGKKLNAIWSKIRQAGSPAAPGA